MHSDDGLHETDGEATFQTDLESLILRAFAGGVPVEGDWEVTLPVADAPNWRVTVERTAGPSE